MSTEYTELSLLKCCEQRSHHERFSRFVKSTVLTDDAKAMLEDLSAYYAATSTDTIDWRDYETWYVTAKAASTPKARFDLTKGMIHQLQSATFTPNVEAVMKHFVQLAYVKQVLDVCLNISSKGKGDLMDIDAILGKYAIDMDVEDRRRAKYVTATVGEAISEVFRNSGADWPIDSLNTGVGPISKGDFIVVAARPNAGKTSFVLQAASEFIKQMDGPILFVNNEERGVKIKARYVQVVLKKNRFALEAMTEADIEAALVKEQGASDRLRILEADYISVTDVERAVAELKPAIVVFNVLDKITGLETKEGETARLRRLYQWARTIASKGAVVFAIGQASEDAEGEAWIRQNQLYGSKTGAAGEADLIITIGNKNDPAEPNKRYIHTPKNKLPGGKKSIPANRHGYHVLEFDPETGCYNDL